MSALVERIISLRDDIRCGRGTITRVELDILADAANAINERDETIHALRRQVERRDEALSGLIEHARPSNWDDNEDPEQLLAWQVAHHIVGLT